MLELMVDYATQRQQFNTKIGDFQMVQQQMLDSNFKQKLACILPSVLVHLEQKLSDTHSK